MSLKSNKFSGITTYKRLGKDVIRSLPLTYNDANNTNQQPVRNKYLTALQFCKRFCYIYKDYWSDLPVNRSYWNEALSFTILNSLVPSGQNWVVDLNLIKISNGLLEGFQGITGVISNSTQVSFQYNDNSGTGNAEANDLVCSLCIEQNSDKISFNTSNCKRSDQSFLINFTPGFLISPYHAWFYIFFTRPDKSIVQNSIKLLDWIG